MRNWMESCGTRCGWVWLITHAVNWGSMQAFEVCACVCVCVFLWSSFQLGGVFCVNLVFFTDEIKHEQMWNPNYAPIVPCSIPELKCMRVFERNTVIELTIRQREHEMGGKCWKFSSPLWTSQRSTCDQEHIRFPMTSNASQPLHLVLHWIEK